MLHKVDVRIKPVIIAKALSRASGLLLTLQTYMLHKSKGNRKQPSQGEEMHPLGRQEDFAEDGAFELGTHRCAEAGMWRCKLRKGIQAEGTVRTKA